MAKMLPWPVSVSFAFLPRLAVCFPNIDNDDVTTTLAPHARAAPTCLAFLDSCFQFSRFSLLHLYFSSSFPASHSSNLSSLLIMRFSLASAAVVALASQTVVADSWFAKAGES